MGSLCYLNLETKSNKSFHIPELFLAKLNLLDTSVTNLKILFHFLSASII